MSYQVTWDGRSGYGGKKKHTVRNVILAVLALLVLLFGALEVVIGVKSRGRGFDSGNTADVMIVFGCQVMPDGPSLTLRDRLDTALDYLADHPGMTVVVTGGKGDNEHKSEAQCMHDYLREQGFQGTVLLEDRAENTWQNIVYTGDLLREKGYDTTQNVLVVSSDFHLARIEMLYARAGGTAKNIYSLAAPVSHLPTRVQMFFREPLAFVKSFLMDR